MNAAPFFGFVTVPRLVGVEMVDCDVGFERSTTMLSTYPLWFGSSLWLIEFEDGVFFWFSPLVAKVAVRRSGRTPQRPYPAAAVPRSGRTPQWPYPAVAAPRSGRTPKWPYPADFFSAIDLVRYSDAATV